jgi:hypothetical protein
VGDAPAPFVLDLERGTVQPITGLPAAGERGVSVHPLGMDALVLSSRLCRRCQPGPGLYLVRHGSRAATRLGRALQAVPSRDGRALWTLSRQGALHCAIRKLDLDGRPVRADRRVHCRTGLVAELPAGLLVRSSGPGGSDAHSALLEPDGGVVRREDSQAQPAVGTLVLTGSDRRTLRLENVRTRSSHRLRWPSGPDYELSEVVGQPNGRLAAVEFATYSPLHRVDLWLLDTRSRRWQHLPGMPRRLVPKITETRWTAGGRLVILSGDLLAVWRPGEPRLAAARVRPSTQPGTGFVVW